MICLDILTADGPLLNQVAAMGFTSHAGPMHLPFSGSYSTWSTCFQALPKSNVA